MDFNIEALSQKAGVSTATVSRALNDKPGVSEKRRKAIKEMASQLGYRPNPQASALRSRTRSGWTLLTRSSTSQITQHRNQHFLSTLREMESSIQVITTAPNEDFKIALNRIWHRPPAVLLVHGIPESESQALEEMGRDSGTAVVSIDRTSKVFDSVCIDRAEGTRLAARLILTGGAKHPIFFTQRKWEHVSNDERNRGIFKAYKEIGLTPTKDQFVCIEGADAEMGRKITLELLESRYVDAIFTYSDEVGYGVLRALFEKGIKVPEDIRLVGFDDLPHSSMTTPNLTSVGQPVQEMVDLAISLAQERQANPQKEIQSLQLPTRLIVRESCPLLNHSHRENTFLTPQSI
jgi:LacI family transcriptional regulator